MCCSFLAVIFIHGVPDAMRDAGDPAVKQTQSLPSWRLWLVGKMKIEQAYAKCLKEKSRFNCFAFLLIL